MKRLFLIAIAIFLMSEIINAQSAIELAKQQQELNEFNRKLLNMEPSKEAKRQAQKYEKDGWTEPAGELSLAMQIEKSQLMGLEKMADEDGNITNRYILQDGQVTSKTYNAGFAECRANALTEIASSMKTQLAGKWKNNDGNKQNDAASAEAVSTFRQEMNGIIDASITNAIPVLSMYRCLPDKHFEVKVRYAFDKKELIARLKRNIQKKLKIDGDELNDLVNDCLNDSF